jgi:hypothetical protein
MLYRATAAVGESVRKNIGVGSTGGSGVAAPTERRAATKVACGSVVKYCEGISATTRRISIPMSYRVTS